MHSINHVPLKIKWFHIVQHIPAEIRDIFNVIYLDFDVRKSLKVLCSRLGFDWILSFNHIVDDIDRARVSERRFNLELYAYS